MQNIDETLQKLKKLAAGENSPLLDGEDDYYEMFLAELRAMQE